MFPIDGGSSYARNVTNQKHRQQRFRKKPTSTADGKKCHVGHKGDEDQIARMMSYFQAIYAHSGEPARDGREDREIHDGQPSEVRIGDSDCKCRRPSVGVKPFREKFLGKKEGTEILGFARHECPRYDTDGVGFENQTSKLRGHMGIYDQQVVPSVIRILAYRLNYVHDTFPKCHACCEQKQNRYADAGSSHERCHQAETFVLHIQDIQENKKNNFENLAFASVKRENENVRDDYKGLLLARSTAEQNENHAKKGQCSGREGTGAKPGSRLGIKLPWTKYVLRELHQNRNKDDCSQNQANHGARPEICVSEARWKMYWSTGSAGIENCENDALRRQRGVNVNEGVYGALRLKNVSVDEGQQVKCRHTNECGRCEDVNVAAFMPADEQIGQERDR